jgi:L-threonylcarbamoyladenylate synthase
MAACFLTRAVRTGRMEYAGSVIDTLPVHHHTRVLSLLSKGEIIAFPTGTTYGFGVNALDAGALTKLNTLKGRDTEKTYSLLLPTQNRPAYVDLSPQEEAALKTFAEKPLTLLVKPRPPLVGLAKDGSVGVRTPDHPFTKQLVDLLTFPITATSANRSGQPPAYSVSELTTAFPNAAFMVVDGGELPKRKPSTVAKWENGKWSVIREGDVTARELSHITEPSHPGTGDSRALRTPLAER